MYKVAIIKDDPPTSGQIRDWVLLAAPDTKRENEMSWATPLFYTPTARAPGEKPS
jgi:hypothetical protein